MSWLRAFGIGFVLFIGVLACLPALRPRIGWTDRRRALALGLPLIALAVTAIVDGATPPALAKSLAVVAIYWVGLAWIGLQLIRALLNSRRQTPDARRQ
jgi:hypothetical protein